MSDADLDEFNAMLGLHRGEATSFSKRLIMIAPTADMAGSMYDDLWTRLNRIAPMDDTRWSVEQVNELLRLEGLFNGH